MDILLGVLPDPPGEKLVLIRDGHPWLADSSEEAVSGFPNYPILKAKDLKVRKEPVSGYGVFQFRYGPVTSGIREAGSFSLYTYGEKILHCAIDLAWKHRRMETQMTGKTPDEAVLLAAHVCGNFSASHGIACCRAAEDALGIRPDNLIINWRTLFLEAERIYNHLHVIYKLAAAAAQKVLAAHLAGLYEEALRTNKVLSGSRFLMDVNGINRIGYFPDSHAILEVIRRYKRIAQRFEALYRHSLGNPNFLDRLHRAGVLSRKQALGYGLSGPSLRACGLQDGLNGTTGSPLSLPVITQQEGDALARMETRAEELVNSCQYMIDHLKTSDSWEPAGRPAEKRDTAGEGIGIAHSPSGAMAYYLQIRDGRVARARICTPSYVGMYAFSEALTNQVFTDFPFVFDSFGVHFTDAAC